MIEIILYQGIDGELNIDDIEKKQGNDDINLFPETRRFDRKSANLCQVSGKPERILGAKNLVL